MPVYKPKYQIGQHIFHATPESDKGIIVNINHDFVSNVIKYEVAFGRRAEDNIWCDEVELSESKIFT